MTTGLLNAELCSSSSVRCHLPYIIFVHVDCKIFNDTLQLFQCLGSIFQQMRHSFRPEREIERRQWSTRGYGRRMNPASGLGTGLLSHSPCISSRCLKVRYGQVTVRIMKRGKNNEDMVRIMKRGKKNETMLRSMKLQLKQQKFGQLLRVEEQSCDQKNERTNRRTKLLFEKQCYGKKN